MFLLFFATVIVSVFFVSEVQADYYSYRKPITINSGQVSSGPHSNFPMLFSVTDANLKSTGSGGHVQNSSGYDIVFRGSDGIQIDHEIEKYMATTGEFVAWGRVSSIWMFAAHGSSLRGQQQD